MLARKITKGVARIITGASTMYVVNSILSANLNPVKTIHKVEAKIGTYVIGGLIGDKVADWTDATIDAIFDVFDPEVKPTTEIEVA